MSSSSDVAGIRRDVTACLRSKGYEAHRDEGQMIGSGLLSLALTVCIVPLLYNAWQGRKPKSLPIEMPSEAFDLIDAGAGILGEREDVHSALREYPFLARDTRG